MKTFVLVYQAGIANVFENTKGTNTRILQSDFRACENFCRGLSCAGARVLVKWCNRAGDIALFEKEWSGHDFGNAPFSDKFAKDLISPESF